MPPQRTVLAEGKHLRLARIGTWEYCERRNISGIVCLVAVTDRAELVLIEQFRPPVDCRVIELPAGLAGDIPGQETEELAAAARRELLEETGYEAGALERLTEGPTSPGFGSERITMFLARNVRRVSEGGGDSSESIVVHHVPLKQVPDWLEEKQRAGIPCDPKIYAALYFAGEKRPARRTSRSAPRRRKPE